MKSITFFAQNKYTQYAHNNMNKNNSKLIALCKIETQTTTIAFIFKTNFKKFI